MKATAYVLDCSTEAGIYVQFKGPERVEDAHAFAAGLPGYVYAGYTLGRAYVTLDLRLIEGHLFEGEGRRAERFLQALDSAGIPLTLQPGSQSASVEVFRAKVCPLTVV